MNTTFESRRTEVPVDPLFISRWSPRAFSEDPIAEETIKILFEAARWSPSSFNEQPWRFVYATSDDDRKVLASVLVESNRVWASRAPLLSIIFAKKTFTRNGATNRWAAFDAGAAWASLTFQARLLGLYTHAMAGFDEEQAYAVTGMDPAEYEAMAAMAIGRRAEPETLPEHLARQEKPNGRLPLETILIPFESKRGDSE